MVPRAVSLNGLISAWLVVSLSACHLGCTSRSGPLVPLREASGIARQGEWLLIVGDDAHGGYFRHPLAEGPEIPLLPARLTWLPLSPPLEAQDLEAIDVLADQRVVALSEELAQLVGEEGVVARYPKELRPIDKRGLEGLAVRRLPGGASRLAVIWEGGIPPSDQPQLAARTRPLILIHDLERGDSSVHVDVRELAEEGAPKASSPGVRWGQVVDLRVPAPPGGRGRCFRAPDLLWHDDRREGWGFLVLLSSEGPERDDRYAVQWLQRFRANGIPYGDPLDLHALVPERLRSGVNWEGLGWLEEGQRLILVHDTPPAGTPTAVVVEVPEAWRH